MPIFDYLKKKGYDVTFSDHFECCQIECQSPKGTLLLIALEPGMTHRHRTIPHIVVSSVSDLMGYGL